MKALRLSVTRALGGVALAASLAAPLAAQQAPAGSAAATTLDAIRARGAKEGK
jgi:hypothetical protein